MVKLKSGKKLIIPIISALLLAVLFIANFSAFQSAKGFKFGSFAVFLAFYILFLGVMAVEIKLPKLASSLVSAVLFIAGPFLCLEMVILLVGAQHYVSYIYFDNLVFYAVLQLIVFAITQSTRTALVTEFAVSYILHAANQIVLLIRGTPLVPTDLFAIGTAMTVTSPDQWHFDAPLLVGTAGFCALIALALKFKLSYPKAWIRIVAAAVSLGVAAAGALFIYNIDYASFSTSTFDTESTNNLNGVALSFYINARKMKFDKPIDYDEERMLQFLEQYEDETLPEDAELPNIIVIMNESFSDLSYMGKFKTDQPYMPYYNQLIKTCPSGKLLVSVLGGGTCNTEFEYLTGLSMMYMPNSCYTYMQHVKRELPTIASYLKSYGYETVAMHPFYEVCWKRNVVYKLMQFDDFISGEDMTSSKTKYVSVDRWEKGFGSDVEYVRTLISDSFFYDKVIEQFESSSADKKFIFGVTVQNHSGYEYSGDDFVTDVHVTKPEGYYPRTEQYLSLMKKSDEALKKLIEYFEGVDEKTIIVFFGDHQPNIEISFLNEVAPYRNLIVNSFLTRYETPFFIWANYDIGGNKDLGIISPNFLSVKTLEYAGVPLSKEYQMIRDVQGVAKAMNTWGYFDRAITYEERKKDASYRDDILNIYNFYTYYTLTNGTKDR